MTTTIIDSDTLTTSFSLMTSSQDNADIDDTLVNASVTAVTVSSTLSTASSNRAYAEDANRYIDSLTDEQVYTLEQMVSNRYEELVNEENIKVYTKV